ncbi:MAG: thioredoxin family protein [Desulfobulbaceae bacterium]|nr:thioredoxin family protein [Desulfobulbaceae bacterium]MCK5404040.1 thioredoxin family protein [Desulfobulbaceae bacterium]
MDTPAQKTIKVGKNSVGLVGLDMALHTAKEKDLTTQEAAAFLYTELTKKNYIPDSARDLYIEALEREYRRYCNPEDSTEQGLVIRVLGRDCVSCDKIYTMSIEILQKFNIAADIEIYHDADEIMRYGVISTPSLIINNKVKSAGRLPSLSEIENWIREEADMVQ